MYRAGRSWFVPRLNIAFPTHFAWGTGKLSRSPEESSLADDPGMYMCLSACLWEHANHRYLQPRRLVFQGFDETSGIRKHRGEESRVETEIAS